MVASFVILYLTRSRVIIRIRQMRKKKILWNSNHIACKTGFAGFTREILTYLYKTGKYDLSLYASGVTWTHPEFEKWPWKIYGTLPNDSRELQMINNDPKLARDANYGAYLVDRVMKEVKPDIFFASEDVWGIDIYKDKSWWNKIPCVVHTTLDSRPILQSAIDLAKTTPYFYCWADFATKDMNKMGFENVKTLRGTVNNNVYRRLSTLERDKVRESNGIPKDAFCVGMLSRNQLRKSFPNLIEGYKMFKIQNPQIKNTRLLFFTHFGEGWDIPKLCKEHGVDENEVLATYKCRATNDYFIMPFKGQDLDNPKTGHQKSLISINIRDGLTDEQVNEWYNILNVYAHPFTSGGMERSIYEAKLAELITIVTNYSCGEDVCVEEATSFPLEFSEYREFGTQFIKANTYPSSIAKQLKKVYEMTSNKREELGRKARKWTLENTSVEVIGKKLEELFDSLPYSNYDFNESEKPKNPNAAIIDLEDSKEWIKGLYRNILNREVDDNDDGLKYWLNTLNQAPNNQLETRARILEYFRKVATQENAKLTSGELSEFGDEPYTDRVLINIPESLGDCLYITSLLKDARELYKDKKIYIATKPQYFPVFEHLEGRLIDKVINWRQEFEDEMSAEGYSGTKGIAAIILNPHFFTQRMLNYLHNGQDKTKIDLKYS